MALPATTLCNNILRRSFMQNIPVTPMKLQKLLYFVCSEYSKKSASELISEPFEVWKYGPVVPSVYAEFKSFGSSPITKFAIDASGDPYMADESRSLLLRSVLDLVWTSFCNYSGVDLSRITHEEGSGWQKAFARHHSTISAEEMRTDVTYAKYMQRERNTNN